MTAKHTRDQWEYGKKQFDADTGVHYYDITADVEGEKIYLAEVFDEANARQMVSSPDLLAALEEIANMDHDYYCEGYCGVDVAHAAIAKTKGGTP